MFRGDGFARFLEDIWDGRFGGFRGVGGFCGHAPRLFCFLSVAYI